MSSKQRQTASSRTRRTRKASEQTPEAQESFVGHAKLTEAQCITEDHALRLQDKVEKLLEAGALDSALLLSELLISLRPMDHISRSTTAKSNYLLGCVLYERLEFRRAIKYFSDYVEDIRQVEPTLSSRDKVNVTVKVARCWEKLDCPKKALDQLLSIPSSERTLTVNLMLGRLYMNNGNKTNGEMAYTEALKQDPYAMEAAIALARSAALRNTPPNASSQRSQSVSIDTFYSTPSNVAEEDAVWMHSLVQAHMCLARQDLQGTIAGLEQVDCNRFPDNLPCGLLLGKIRHSRHELTAAQSDFEAMHALDEYNLQDMDVYADVLYQKQNKKLTTFIPKLFGISTERPEPWLAAASLAQSKKDTERALEFCDRAIAVAPGYTRAKVKRAQVLLQLGQYSNAEAAFSSVCQIHRDFDALSGLTKTYCQLMYAGQSRQKQATMAAKTLVRLFPTQSRSYSLLGEVYAMTGNQSGGKKAFEQALDMCPSDSDAMLGVVGLMEQSGNVQGAIDRLLEVVELIGQAPLFTKLAELYGQQQRHPEAMNYFHRALAVDPACEQAVQGMELLERMMAEGFENNQDNHRVDESMTDNE